MPNPVYSAADYAQGMANLLPRGAAWARYSGSVLMQLLAALAPTYARSGASAAALPADLSPASTVHFIPEWESTLGLPDSCTPTTPTTTQRQAAILSKFIGSGGQSISYYRSVATALGFTITVTEYAVTSIGSSVIGRTTLSWPGWQYVWLVHATGASETYFKLGSSVLGDPFAAYSSTELLCRLNKIKPAHTQLVVTIG